MTGFIAKTIVTGLVVAGFISQRPLPFLQKDKVITYKAYVKIAGDKLKEYLTVVEIEQVTSSGSYVHSEGTVHFDGDAEYSNVRYFQEFASDSAAFYSSGRNFIYNRTDNVHKVKIDQPDSLQYPYQMKLGDSLKNCIVKFSLSSGQSKSKGELSFTNRVVINPDTLNLPIGRIAAWKIEADMTTQSVTSALGKSKRETNTCKLYEWFNAEYGIVKSEREVGGTFTSVELKSIK